MAGKLKLAGQLAETAKKMLKDTCRIFEESNIDYVLEGGTLLGIVRESRLLPWDNDLDITITDNFTKKLLSIRWRLWLAGYRTRIRTYKLDIGPFKKGRIRMMKIQTRKLFFFKGVSLLDIFIKTKKDGKYFWTVGARNPVLKSAPCQYYEEFTKTEFDGHKYSIPKDYEEYLVYRYGNWQTPVKEWNFRKDDNAIVN